MSENERLREVLKRVSGELHYQTTPKGINHYSICKITAIIDKALYAEPETCEWRRKTDTGGEPYGPWITSCGNEWDLQGPEGIGPFEYPDEYGFEFCPFTSCGSKIEVKGE